MRHFSAVVWVVAVVGVARAQGLDRAVGVDLPGAALGLAVSEATGVVAVTFPTEGVVRGYPRLVSDGTLEGAVEYHVAGPVGLVHKRVGDKGYFLVLSHEDRTVHVLDEGKLQAVGKIALSGERPVSLAAASRADVPWAYYVWGDMSNGKIARIDLKAMKDEGTLSLSHAHATHDVGEVAVSADGRMLYGRRPGASPSGYRSFRVEEVSREGVVQAQLLVNRHEQSEWYVPDPHGQFVASGQVVWSADLEAQNRLLRELVDGGQRQQREQRK